MMVNKERVRLGVDALRSGDYEQGTGSLHNTYTETWCCLGVLSDVAEKNGLDVHRSVIDGGYERFGPDDFVGSAGYLCDAVMEWYGFENHDPMLDFGGVSVTASQANDGNARFPAIADAFERTFLEES